ncbi:MAG TPA: sugar ABC transporter ATP-binding protein, partial [Candidatus Obscuribacterales bacterium]
GAGKSTLMKVLSGAIIPDAGQMSLYGKQYKPSNPLEARLAGVAMIYQELSLAPHLNACQNIFLGMEPRKGWLLDRKKMRFGAEEACKEMMHELPLDVPVGAMSISDRQIVEIARACAIGCKVLILDEPTSSLTRHDVERLFQLIRRVRDKGYSVVYISHFLEEIAEIADRFTVLRDGRTVSSGDVKSVRSEEIITQMIGRELKNLYPRSLHAAGEEVLKVEGIGGGKVKAASLDLRKGEVVGIAGLVGSGRTEFLRAIFGLDQIVRGKVQIGYFAGPLSPAASWNNGMGMVSEDRKGEGLAIGLSIGDNIILSHPLACEKNGLMLPRLKKEAARSLVDKLRIRCAGPDQAVKELSGGNQQKVALARLLHHGVTVFILDEPTRGIDVASKSEIYKLIDELAARGCAVLMVSSYLPELLGVCDRIAVMCRGVLSAALPASEWTEHGIMSAATAGAAEAGGV